MTAEGSNPQLLIGGASSSFDPAWSVNDKIAFTAWDEKGRPKLMVAEADGSNPQNFSSNFSTDSQPAWSPDGKRLAFRNGTRSGYGRIYWMYADGRFEGANPDEVSAPNVEASAPDWSPDGEYVIYSAINQLWLAEWDKFGNVVAPVAFSNLSTDADWSPDGLWITFESWRDGTANHDIYIMTPAGGLITRLTTDLARDYQPAWRPPAAASGR
jgi:TolB protein